MQIKEMLLGIPILFFILWVFAAPIPQDRIVRGCEPITWIGNIATSTTALSADSHTATTARWSDKLNYSCKYTVWRLFYQEDYSKAVASGRIIPLGKHATDPASSTRVPTAQPKKGADE